MTLPRIITIPHQAVVNNERNNVPRDIKTSEMTCLIINNDLNDSNKHMKGRAFLLRARGISNKTSVTDKMFKNSSYQIRRLKVTGKVCKTCFL